MSILKETKRLLSQGASALQSAIKSIPDDKLEDVEKNIKKATGSAVNEIKKGINTATKAAKSFAKDVVAKANDIEKKAKPTSKTKPATPKTPKEVKTPKK